MNTIEHKFYEQGDIWRAERWLEGDELKRFMACLQILPQDISTLLDVGAGNGAFLHLLEKSGTAAKLFGVERSDQAIANSVCKTVMSKCSAESLPFANNSFDIVSALEVLEHLPCGIYEKTLNELQRVARRFILIDVPYRENRLQTKCPYCSCLFSPHFHMRSFHKSTLITLFPKFKLIQTYQLKRSINLLTILTLPFRRRTYGQFPRIAICPQCGYRDCSGVSIQNYNSQNNLLHDLMRLLPKFEAATEILALYERDV